jgi:hypothetical protein
MSFSLCTVIAEAFKTKRQRQTRHWRQRMHIAIHGQLRRSGCTPAEPYPPGCIENMHQGYSGVSIGFPIFNHSKSTNV